MLPNYTGRYLDRLLAIAAQQTSAIRENPDDPTYVERRAAVLKTLTKAFWRVRTELHRELRGADVSAPPPSSKPK